MSKQAVVLIFAHKPELDWYECIALRQCIRVLDRHPIRLVCPEGLDVTAYRAISPQLVVDFIPTIWMSSVRAYNRLKILPFLYEKYADFEFMLTYELDAFVFKDELDYWCAQGWDYIGAPWFEGYYDATPSSPPIGVGNSGFSLRRISTMLRVMRTWQSIRPAIEVFSDWRRYSNISAGGLWQLFGNLTWRNCFHYRLNRFGGNEDGFWSRAGTRIEGFRLAPYEVARHFSFEANPGRLFFECGNKLPFGCHKWTEREPEFWKPFIEDEGHCWLRSEHSSGKNLESDQLNRTRASMESLRKAV